MSNILKSKLQNAEASFNNAFGTLKKIESTSIAAREAALAEVVKKAEEIERARQEKERLAERFEFYKDTSKKISDFINSLKA